MKAIWNGRTLAESDDTLVVEGNHYFPADSVRAEYFVDSDTHTMCGVEGRGELQDDRRSTGSATPTPRGTTPSRWTPTTAAARPRSSRIASRSGRA